MTRQEAKIRFFIGLAMVVGLALSPVFVGPVQAVEQGTITITKSWVDGHQPADPVEDCFLVTSDVAGDEVLGETCTTANTIVIGPSEPALQTGVTYYVWEAPTDDWAATGDNPVEIVIPDTTGDVTVAFENRQLGASLEVREFACPTGFASDRIADHRAECQDQPRAGVELNASGPDGHFVEAITDAAGLAIFPGFTVPGEVTLAESIPTGDFADFIVECARTDTGAEIPVSERTNGRAAVAFDLPAELVDAQTVIRCDWYNIPAPPPLELILSINPDSGADGQQIAFTGDGYTEGGDVTVVMGGDGLIVADAVASDGGAIFGTFDAPARASLTGESSDDIPVWAIDESTGQESPRVTFTYVQPEPTATATAAPPSPTATAPPLPTATMAAPSPTVTTVPPTATTAPTGTPTAAVPTIAPADGRIVRIQPGACGGLADAPVYSLNDPSIPTTTPQGALEASVAGVSYTVVDVALSALLSAPHSINAFLTDGDMESALFCGEIGGPVRADGSIAVGLRELGDSGLTGIAYLSPNPSNAAQTQVSLFVAAGLAEEDPSLIPATGDAPFITAIVDEGPIAPEFQAGYEINIFADGRVDITVRPPGSSGALAEDQRTAEEEVRTLTLSNDALNQLLADLHAIGFFTLTQAEDVDPSDQLVGGPTSLLSVALVDGTWDVNGNGLSPDAAAVLDQAQKLVAGAVGGVEVPNGQ